MRGSFLFLAMLVGATKAHAAELKAGVAVGEITPPVGGPMWGYAARHNAPSQRIRDPLFAKVVVLDDGDKRIMIASLDLGRPPTRKHMETLRKQLNEKNITQMFVVASHTHHGPIMELDNWPDATSPYGARVVSKLAELVDQALKNMTAVTMSANAKQLPLNRNRQSKRADAQVDRELTVLQLVNNDKNPVATLISFAAHPTMIDAKLMEISADFPGALSRHVERETNAPCLFLQGASGDLSAKSLPGQSGPDDFGKALADEVISLCKELKPVEQPLPMRVAREEFSFPCRLNVSDPLVKFSIGQAFFPALVDFYEGEYAKGSRPEFTAMLMGQGIGMVGFSGEMFCGHALSLKRRARLNHLMVFGCCNDYQQYFPTIEGAAEGGYGTIPPIAMAEIGSGEKMTDRALIKLNQLVGKLP